MTTPQPDSFNECFRVWPDGTVQAVMDGEPYDWMSDDYLVVEAFDEEAALKAAEERTHRLLWRDAITTGDSPAQPSAGQPAGAGHFQTATPESGHSFVPVEDVIRTLENTLPILDAAAAGQRICGAAGDRAREWRQWLRFLRSEA